MTSARPKVIGLGLSKTGTKSLQEALVSLGYSNRSWNPELLEQWYYGNIDAVFAVTDAYDCVEDWPYLAAYRELIDRYGASARYVLTVRKSSAVWLDSVIAHADRVGPQHNVHRRMAFGYDHPRGHEAQYVAYYENHNANVRAEIARHQLENCFAELCWENGDGWEQLCRLIGHSQPTRSFPHNNRRPEPIPARL